MLTSSRAIGLFITPLSHKSLPVPLTGTDISHYKALGDGIYLLVSVSHMSLRMQLFWDFREKNIKGISQSLKKIVVWQRQKQLEVNFLL